MAYPPETGFPAVSLRVAATPRFRPEAPMSITVTRDRTGKCPVHKLMTQATAEIITGLATAGA